MKLVRGKAQVALERRRRVKQSLWGLPGHPMSLGVLGGQRPCLAGCFHIAANDRTT